MDKYKLMFVDKEDAVILIERLAKQITESKSNKLVIINVDDLKGGLIKGLEE